MKKLFLLISVVGLLALTGCGKTATAKKHVVQPKVCTQEAQLCPDGSYVTRTGANCEFAPCPVVK